MDLLELFGAQRAWVHTLGLSPKVLQSSCVGSGWSGEGNDLDGHDVTVRVGSGRGVPGKAGEVAQEVHSRLGLVVVENKAVGADHFHCSGDARFQVLSSLDVHHARTLSCP